MRHDLDLAGPLVRLRPLEPADAPALVAISAADDLRWHTVPLPLDEDTATRNIEALTADATTRALAVVGAADGEFRGMTSFYDLVATVPRVEIGHTHYGRRWWGGETNPAAKLLLLTHAFEVWGCERVALRCDAANVRSAAAIRRLGAQPEGVLRAHRRRYDGTVADTAYFSIVSDEWPQVRDGLRRRLGELPERTGP